MVIEAFVHLERHTK